MTNLLSWLKSNACRECCCFLFTSIAFIHPLNAQNLNWQLTDGAAVHPEYRGATPKKSDVIFSTRFKRENAPEVARDFGATRIEWVYSTDKEFIKTLKSTANWFGGAVNANVHLPNDSGYARDFDGHIIVAPWMKGWGAKYVTSTHPDTINAIKELAAKTIEAGADSIQVDDPLLQLHSAHWGGDFNSATLQGFNSYLSSSSDKHALLLLKQFGNGDYRQYLLSRSAITNTKDYIARYRSLPTTGIWMRYLRTSVRQHYIDLRSYLNKLSGRPFPISMNLAGLDRPYEYGQHFFLAEYADYVISETPIMNISELAIRAATARALALGFVPSLMPRSVADNRLAIATLYALGAQPLVPWDVYDGNDERGQAKRFFGTPADYGFLYAFVRKHPELFDNTETTAVVGIPVPVDKFKNEDTTRLIRRLVENQVPFAFVLTGGTERKFRIDVSRIKHFKMLITVNPETDFSPDDLTALRSVAIERVNSNQLTDAAIRELSPLTVVGGIGAVKVYPRSNPAGGGRNLIIHVIDESRSNLSEGDQNCQKRIGLKKSVTAGKTINRAMWSAGTTTVAVAVLENEREYSITVKDCRLWGILSLDLR